METCTLEQRVAIEAVLNGDSVFITGPGGTGKSYLLEALRQEFKKIGKALAITAMTGCAALLLGSHATTLHSWAGIGLGRGTVESTVESIWKNGKAKKNWRETECLVIDEVSMLTPQLLALLDGVGRKVRRIYDTPFGGLQIVFVGDFYQLPPISKETAAAFAFQSDLWKTVVTAVYQLTTIHRQKDVAFQTVLNEARRGELSDESYKILQERQRAIWKGQPIRPTMLFTRNTDIDTINNHYSGKLLTEEHVFVVRDLCPAAPIIGKKKPKPMIVDKLTMYEPEVCLKVGAQVMLLHNLDPENGLVNGSRGVVEGFTTDGLPRVKFASLEYARTVDRHQWTTEDSPVIREQIPLRLAYALTIHKAQGASLDSALIDVGPSTFEYGQAYVALSRVRSLEALYVHDLDRGAFRVHPAVREFYRGLRLAQALSNTK